MRDTDFAIVGLGNPGRKYEETRHNVGFLVADFLAQRNGERFQATKWNAEACRYPIDGCRVFILKPQTFMNLSGRAVVPFCSFYRIPADRLLVVHDDIDMSVGRIKLVSGGGAGGHNGIKSITETLGTPEYLRLKIGIGRPGDGITPGEMPVEAYVLANLGPHDLETIRQRLPLVEEGIALVVRGELAAAQTLLNRLK
ncbi:aminoacyl-tRNA hydrolase [Desulfofustis limnaeus]|jgi:PTH1 family peptidyl-tRNA hydrolase|uniref:Peptidyl-tRNA hydrolase n=1 Tax=Desulfofustis limnaeus TaxID=2740163 RepID=A0ABM7W9C4_9BACT|nr:aminoacyl-tRNA hydrolase [Desulfofustis limnaeus]MDX9895498.1 aminoacyl-tRNA hydrolase [Desulfofustis sp.]BDD87534.1 peptidyl-tRNA hydrolase [Desulfofustis limnaeus]